jgi:hypothetical protein
LGLIFESEDFVVFENRLVSHNPGELFLFGLGNWLCFVVRGGMKREIEADKKPGCESGPAFLMRGKEGDYFFFEFIFVF